MPLITPTAIPFNTEERPVELTLLEVPQGISLCRKPAQEIAHLHRESSMRSGRELKAGEKITVADTGYLCAVLLEVEASEEPRSDWKYGDKNSYTITVQYLVWTRRHVREPWPAIIKLQLLMELTRSKSSSTAESHRCPTASSPRQPITFWKFKRVVVFG